MTILPPVSSAVLAGAHAAGSGGMHWLLTGLCCWQVLEIQQGGLTRRQWSSSGRWKGSNHKHCGQQQQQCLGTPHLSLSNRHGGLPLKD